ncbi:U3 small nucleolar RNA-associated protein 11 [Xylariaceae sp. FL0804]|nr:U3 small nucleolar RNA-associated protein 11 [Xylariaceae sp. FL0804]
MSSSMRNAVQRRNHKERGQLIERQKLGLLEKHKDYSARAKDYNKKKQQLRNLRQKAADRNEDEFYFGMMSRKGPSTVVSKGKKWTGTVDGDRGNKAMDMDTVRLLKTQDMGYLRTTRNVVAKEVRQTEERIVGLGGSLEEEQEMDLDLDDELGFGDEVSAKKTKPKKTVFADGVQERQERIHVDTGEDENEDDEGLSADETSPEKLRVEQREKLLAKLQRRLQHSRKKLRVLARAEHQLEIQRARMAKTPTQGTTTKSGKKIKVRERKR